MSSPNPAPTTADLLLEMMQQWRALNERVRAAYPHASEEDRYQIARAAFNRSLGIEVPR